MKPPPLSAQTVVITGASSGIGRASALRFARAGARVVAVARDPEALASLVAEVQARGGRCVAVPGDIADPQTSQAAVTTAEENDGSISTLVNAAGVLQFSAVRDTTPEDFRRVMEINFMGQINAIRAVLPVMERAGGGTIISVSSLEAVCPLPLHGAYAASKAAVDAAIGSLRRELIASRSPISVVTMRPAVIDTPIYDSARNLLPTRPTAPRPFYDPNVAAAAIVHAAQHPTRLMYVGGAARVFSLAQTVAPRALDAVLGRFGIDWMSTDEPEHGGQGNLQRSNGDTRVRGGLPRPGRRVSIYMLWRLHRTRIISGVIAVGTAAVLSRTPRSS